MKDPFPLPPRFAIEYLKPVWEHFKLPLLPHHIHELLVALLLYQFLYIYLGPRVSRHLASKTYPNLQGRAKLDWDIHVVSMTQATIMSFLAQYTVFFDKERKQMNAQDRAYSYTEFSAMVLAVANGYFVWHLVYMAIHVKAYGWGMLAHACATNFLMIQGFRPAFLTYGVASYLYEWSNIPLNIHRALGKLNLQHTKFYIINGVALFIVFLFSRIIWGTYLTWWFYKDIWAAYTNEPPVGVEKLPTWLLVGHATSATVLQTLNFVWFFMITRILFSRIWSKKEAKWMGMKEE